MNHEFSEDRQEPFRLKTKTKTTAGKNGGTISGEKRRTPISFPRLTLQSSFSGCFLSPISDLTHFPDPPIPLCSSLLSDRAATAAAATGLVPGSGGRQTQEEQGEERAASKQPPTRRQALGGRVESGRETRQRCAWRVRLLWLWSLWSGSGWVGTAQAGGAGGFEIRNGGKPGQACRVCLLALLLLYACKKPGPELTQTDSCHRLRSSTNHSLY
jgi:hypothetical protein